MVSIEHDCYEFFERRLVDENRLTSGSNRLVLVEFTQGLRLVDAHIDDFLSTWVSLVVEETRKVLHQLIILAHRLLVRNHGLSVGKLRLVTNFDETKAAESLTAPPYARCSNSHHAGEGGFRDEAHQGVKIRRVQACKIKKRRFDCFIKRAVERLVPRAVSRDQADGTQLLLDD